MSRPAVRVATIGIAVGLAVMLVAIAVVVGFKKEVREQIIGFGSHIQISGYSGYAQAEEDAMVCSPQLDSVIWSYPGIKAVQHIVQKPAILKTDTDFQGVLLKGVDSTYSWDFFKSNIIAGDTIAREGDKVSRDALISKRLANLLGLNVGDEVSSYFVQEQVRVRKLRVVGIFETNFQDYDNLYLITDARMLQQLNGWQGNDFTSIEVLLDDYDALDVTTDALFFGVANRFDERGKMLQVKSIKQISPLIFDWLDMLDINAVIILVLMLLVSGFLMISGLLILILERTADIGVLKALGATNWTIRKVFLYQSVFLIGKGMLWGNVVGMLIVGMQYYFHFIPLDPDIYYVRWVPVFITAWQWALINVGSAVLSVLMLVGPSYLITRISPAKAIRFD